MYRIERGEHGYTLTFSGSIRAVEMRKWKEESLKLLEKSSEGFGVFFDLRNLNPLPVDAQDELEEGKREFRKKGMEKLVIVHSSETIEEQFKRMTDRNGKYDWERYINASSEPNWEKKGLDWLIKGIDPKV